jgi:GTPase Era involved in 16S rRNA processing
MGAEESSHHRTTKAKRVMFIGATGEGKSSIINLLIGTDKAKVGDGAHGVTFECQEYTVEHSHINYVLCDTVGLDEGTRGTIPHKEAIRTLVQFVKTYKNGFNLLIFVMKKGRIRADFNENYCVFAETIFSNRVPCVLYVSECEHDDPMDTWRLQNENDLKEYKFSDIVCGTTLTSKVHDDWWQIKREETKRALWNAIEKDALPNQIPITRHLTIWQRALNAVYIFLTHKPLFSGSSITKDKLIEILHNRGVDPDVIDEISSSIN